MPIYFHFADTNATLSNRQALKAFIESLFKKEKQPLESLNYVFCSDEYLLKINQDYLKHDYYTDIITFNLARVNEPVIGDIYISIDRVKDNAKTIGSTIPLELHRVIFHGALHLCGYKDKSKQDIIYMRRAEDKFLKLYFQ